MQGVTGEVDGDLCPFTGEVDVDPQVGVREVHRGSLPGARAQPVDDGILDLLGAEARVVEGARTADEIHRQGATGAEVIFPGQLDDAFVEGVGGFGRDRRQHQQDPAGGSGPETGAVGTFQVGDEGGAALARAHFGKTQPGQFLLQDRLDTAGCGGEERE